MSDPIPERLAQLLARSRRGVTARVNDNDRRQAHEILAQFLVVPRSDVIGTEYGWRYADPGREPRSYVADRETAIEAAVDARMLQRDRGLPVNAEALERPVLAWVPIEIKGDTDV
jgi:hypothetical protein